MDPLALLDLPTAEQERYMGVMLALDEEARAVRDDGESKDEDDGTVNWLEHRGGGGPAALTRWEI